MVVNSFSLSKLISKVVNGEVSLNQKKDDQQSGNWTLPRRYLVAFLAFFIPAILHAHRLNISLALVTMVNNTSVQGFHGDRNATMECPHNTYNTSSAHLSKGSFLWSPELQGYILSSGYLSYLLTQIPGGILAKICGAKKLLVFGLLFASASNLLSPLAAVTHPYILIALSFIRGAAQGVMQPSLNVLLAKWLPINERGYLSTFVYCGFPFGAFFTSIVGGMLCDMEFLDGWPLVFYVFGLLSLILAVLFVFLIFDVPEEDPRISTAELEYLQSNLEKKTDSVCPPTPWIKILLSAPTYAFIFALFGDYWASYHFLSIHPIYFDTILNIPIKESGFLSSYTYVFEVFTGAISCYFTYKMGQNNRFGPDSLRKGFNSLFTAVFCLGLLGVYFAQCDLLLNNIFLYVVVGSLGFSSSGGVLAAVDMSPTFCGPLFGFASAVAGISGFLAPIILGILTNEAQTLFQWGTIFFVTIGIVGGSGAIFHIFGSAEVQPYDPVYFKSTDQIEKETESHCQGKKTEEKA